MPKKDAETATTVYVILSFDEETSKWNEHGDRLPASSSTAAIRKHAASLTDAAGVYIAVPERSFKPTTVTVDTVTTLKLGSI